jgi:hypothetical protein
LGHADCSLGFSTEKLNIKVKNTFDDFLQEIDSFLLSIKLVPFFDKLPRFEIILIIK